MQSREVKFEWTAKFARHIFAVSWKKMLRRILHWKSQGYIFCLASIGDDQIKDRVAQFLPTMTTPGSLDANLGTTLRDLPENVERAIMRHHPSASQARLTALRAAFREALETRRGTVYNRETSVEFHQLLIATLLAYGRSLKLLHGTKGDVQKVYAENVYHSARLLWGISKSKMLSYHLKALEGFLQPPTPLREQDYFKLTKFYERQTDPKEVPSSSADVDPEDDHEDEGTKFREQQTDAKESVNLGTVVDPEDDAKPHKDETSVDEGEDSPDNVDVDVVVGADLAGEEDGEEAELFSQDVHGLSNASKFKKWIYLQVGYFRALEALTEHSGAVDNFDITLLSVRRPPHPEMESWEDTISRLFPSSPSPKSTLLEPGALTASNVIAAFEKQIRDAQFPVNSSLHQTLQKFRFALGIGGQSEDNHRRQIGKQSGDIHSKLSGVQSEDKHVEQTGEQLSKNVIRFSGTVHCEAALVSLMQYPDQAIDQGYDNKDNLQDIIRVWS
jgi:hypothetical protein